MRFTKKTIFELIALIIFFAIIWWIFSNVLIPKWQFEKLNKISIENEILLGEIMSQSIKKAYYLYDDSLLNVSINMVMERLLQNMDSSGYNYTVKVIKNDAINAFVIPGGKIYIFSGLIEFTETPEELASILAHEIGHIEKRHILSRIISNLGIAAIATAIGGDMIIINELLRQLTSRSFYRYQEKEADEFALALLEKSGINPKHKGLLFTRLNEKFDDDIQLPAIFDTHPGHIERLQSAFSYHLAEDFVEIPFKLKWEFDLD